MTKSTGGFPQDHLISAAGAAPVNAWVNIHDSAAAHGVGINGQGTDIIGTSGDDFLQGTDNRELIKGLNGNDELIGNGGADTLDGGNGDDILVGGNGNDTLYGRNGHDIMLGGNGNDTYIGGAGTDWAYFHNVFYPGGDGATGVTVDLSLTGAQDTGQGMDTLITMEDVIGTLNNDVLTGNSGDNLLSGYSGSDTLNGGAGNDYLEGGNGNVVMDGGDGNDTLFMFNQNGEGEKISLATTAVQQIDSTDTLQVTNVENVSGFYYNDTIIGSSADNKLYGDFGNDLLRGGAGNDALYGDGYDHGDGNIVTDAYSVGNDTLIGGAGNDTLVGGGGADVLTGGIGSDTFVYEFLSDSGVTTKDAIDHITDLTNDDSIDLTALEANYGVTLVQVGHFDGSSGTPAPTGEFTLSYDKAAGETYLKIDMNGDGKADMTIALDGQHTDFTNFVL